MKKILALLMFSSFTAFAIPAKYEIKNFDETQVVKFDGSKKKELVIFWATWCEDCKVKLRKQLPALNEHKDVRVIAINVDKILPKAKNFWKDFTAKNATARSLPIYRNPKKDLQKELNAFAVPRWAVYNYVGDEWKLAKTESGCDFNVIANALGMSKEEIKKYD